MSFDPATFRLNSPLGKRILATTREGDYAHPGEEEAIRMTLAPFAGNTGRKWLDAGCGRGGTADFVTRQGWADVTAFDIDGVSVREARQRFPAVSFYECGVADASGIVPGKFDLLYSFNAFYAFPDQPGALEALRSLAADNATLVLFDYADRGGFYESAFARESEVTHWRPIDEASFNAQLTTAGWELEKITNLDGDYDRWYAWLVERFDTRREALMSFAPPEAIDLARNIYTALLQTIRDSTLGGGIFQARAV
ncbi:MAG: class I SAM-dependent methyltransferase [Chthoniobacterales bacterium]